MTIEQQRAALGLLQTLLDAALESGNIPGPEEFGLPADQNPEDESMYVWAVTLLADIDHSLTKCV